MTRLTFAFGLLAACMCAPASAKDYGQVGAVFRVIEPDLLRVIETRLAGMKESGKLDQLNQDFARRSEKRVRRPDPVAGLSPATTPRIWAFDPTITIDHEIRDHKGNVISPAGRRINPLDFVVIKQPLVFIDGDDAAQVAWALAHFKGELSAKLIMVAGAPLELMTAHQRRFYFDQGGKLVAKFGIAHTPAIIEQAGKVMRAREIVIVKGRAG